MLLASHSRGAMLHCLGAYQMLADMKATAQ
jgi:hypothetical protein